MQYFVSSSTYKQFHTSEEHPQKYQFEGQFHPTSYVDESQQETFIDKSHNNHYRGQTGEVLT
jgi:hypothetical protein